MKVIILTRWTNEQKEAIEKTGKNIIVSAGAGSGKTAVLSERVLTHLKNGMSIDEMLILTFTNAAAAEMKDRIRNKISSFDDLKEQLDKIDSAYITTFDAYALSLVKRYNHLLNMSDKINIIDDGMLSLKKQFFLEEIFEEYYSLGDEKFLKLIDDYCLKDDKELFSSIIRISDKLDNLYDKDGYLNNYINSYYSDDNINRLIDEYYDLILKKRSALKNQISNLNYYTENDYIDKLNLSFDNLFRVDNYEKIKICFPDRLPSLPRGSGEEAKAIKKEIGRLRDELKELTRFDDVSFMKDSIYKTRDYMEVIIDIINKLDKKVLEYKKSINCYEFIDIAKYAIRILKENADVCDEIKNTYKEILIDEYQDTNDIQDMFISLIENDNVYMVGDIKQSVYRFRNANPNLFKSKYEDYSKGYGGYKIDLNNNFRSRGEVIDNINLIFNLLMDGNIGGADYITSHQMIYGNTSYDLVNNENYNMEVLTYEKNDIYSSSEIEIFTIAADIKKKVDSGYKIMDKNTGKERCVCYSDFVILMDKSKCFDKYKKVFEYLGIPLTVYRDKAISNSLDIVLIRHILNIIGSLKKGIYDVGYKYSFMSLLRSYLFDYDDNYIFDVITNDKESETVLYSICFGILSRIDSLNTKELYDVIIDEFNFYEKIMRIGDIHEHLITLDGLGKIFNNLSRSGNDLYDVLDYLKDVSAKDLEIKLAFNKESSNSVKIMTIHASKGLEYPICYYSGLGSKFNIKETNYRINNSLKYGFVVPYYDNGLRSTFLKTLFTNDYLDEEVSERLRLFYVALTRAREKMIIVSSVDEDILSYKDGAVINDDTRREYKSFGKVLNSIYKYLKPYMRSVSLDDINITKDYNLSSKKSIDGLRDGSGGLNVMEYNSFERVVMEERFSKNTHDLYSKNIRNNIDFGLEMHKVLEFIDFSNPSYDKLSDYQKSFVKMFMDTGILKNNKNVYKEYEFIYEDDGKEMHGIIDLLIEYDDRYAIVDYKLRNINDEAYIKQLNGYRDYISRLTGKNVDIYLYSIIDGKLDKIGDSVLI